MFTAHDERALFDSLLMNTYEAIKLLMDVLQVSNQKTMYFVHHMGSYLKRLK